MIEFKVWGAGDSEEQDAVKVLAHEAEEAAELFVEENHADFDYESVVDVVVLSPTGEKTEWTVNVEETVSFSASKTEPA